MTTHRKITNEKRDDLVAAAREYVRVERDFTSTNRKNLALEGLTNAARAYSCALDREIDARINADHCEDSRADEDGAIADGEALSE